MSRCKNLFWLICGLAFLTGFIFLVVQASNNRSANQSLHIKQEQIVSRLTNSGDEKLAIDRSIARYTLLLAAFTAVLAISTIGLWLTAIGSGRKQSSDMERMADIAEKQMLIAGRQTDIQQKQHAIGRLQFLATHRPRLRVRHVSLIAQGDVIGHPTLFFANGNKIKGSLVVVNIGGSKAMIIETRYRIFFTKTGLPTSAPYDENFRSDLLLPGQTLDIGESCATPIEDEIVMEPEKGEDRDIRQFDREEWQIYVMGQIQYQDEGGANRFMGFCRKRKPTGRFLPVKSPDYEYED